MERSGNVAPLAKGKLLKTALLLPKSPKKVMLLNSMVFLCLYLNCVQHRRTLPPENSLFLWLLRHPSAFTCLLPTQPPHCGPPSWNLLFLHSNSWKEGKGLGLPPSFSSLSILASKLIIYSWALNTSCLLIIPKFLSHPLTST